MDFLEKIDRKLESIDTRLDQVDRTLLQQSFQLEEHIKRSDLLEEYVESVEEKADKSIEFRDQFNGAFKLIGILATLTAIATFILKLFKIL